MRLRYTQRYEALLAFAARHGVGIEGASMAEPAIERGLRLLGEALETAPAADRAWRPTETGV
jgi:hypothetical protein